MICDTKNKTFLILQHRGIFLRWRGDYAIDREGPYGFDDLGVGGEHVGTPEVQQRRDLSEEDMARLPDPSVIFLDVLDVDTAKLQQLIK